ncbi:MAG: DNA-binding protein [Chloroflexota bacterium]|nr:MAG: DNA-binding protein [Chloroflexota bacterium]
MLLNAEEAAEFLRSSRVKIYRLVKSGQLVAHKVGGTYVFYLRDLHAYVRGQLGAGRDARDMDGHELESPKL